MAMISCGECGTEVSDKATACPKCGNPISSQNATTAASKKTGKGIGCLTVIVLFTILAIFGKFSDDGSSRPGNVDVGPSIGDMVTIRLPSSNDEPVLCATREAQDQFTKLAVAHDTLGIGTLLVANVCFLVEPGASARLIDSGFGVKQVRVMDGKQFSRSGWLPSEWINKYTAPSSAAPEKPKQAASHEKKKHAK